MRNDDVSLRALLPVCVFLLSTATRCIADDESAIAKQAQNPIASMISVPTRDLVSYGDRALYGSREV
jgi:hypothetical protein